MRKLSNLLMAVLLAVGLAAPASSATLSATGTLGVALGALPPISIAGGPVAIAVSTGTGSFVLPAGVFSSSVVLATQLFTGISLISSLNVNAANATITQAGGAATGAVAGTAVVGVLGGLVNLIIPLNIGGQSTAVTAGAAALAVTVTPDVGWTTGAVTITGITTTTTGTAVVNTLVGSGTDARTTGHAGMITLVTPVRVLTNAAGNLPLIASIKLTFATGAEPGTLLLLGSGVIGLAVVGRRRMRK